MGSSCFVPRACVLLAIACAGCGDVVKDTLVPLGAGGSSANGGNGPGGGLFGQGGSGGSAGASSDGGTNSGGDKGLGGLAGDGSGGQVAMGGSGTGGAAPLLCPESTLLGFASVVNGSSKGTTGGGDAEHVRATTAAELKAYATDTRALVIEIAGPIALTEQIRPKPNKTIMGIGTQGILTGGGFYIVNSQNIIIQNLTISKLLPGENDAITVESTQFVWIDHCDLSTTLDDPRGTYDGLIDVTHGSDFVTVSWTKLHDHYQVSLMGHSDNNALEDSGHLTVTWHHNYFLNVESSTPRVRFGKAHLFNNYYENVTGNAISSQLGADVYSENNYFQNVPFPLTTIYSPEDGAAVSSDDHLDATDGMPMISAMSTWLPSNSYAYDKYRDSADSARLLVQQCAGVGKGSFSAAP